MTHEECNQVRAYMERVFHNPVRDIEIEEAAKEISNLVQSSHE